ncbi:MAG: HEAT repeat domain-containing protein [Treponema sp.]|nr:HEAT repeat domain-containing protein [Treponema sp.]
MFSLKRFSILFLMALILVSTAVTQSRDMTIEESYLQESMELMIIRETARSTTREQKLIAIEFMSEAIGRGSTNDEIRQTLDFLSREGRRSVARENNRVVNNFPDIRRQSARLLGQMGTEEARLSLIEVLQYENEPMVLQEAIKALGDIGMNDNNETVIHIAWVMNRFSNLNPDNLMALATIDAFEKIARRSNGLNSPEAVRCLVMISEGQYITPVRDRARQLLAELRTFGM